ncbi:MAG: hypothetical protein JSV52_14400 [Candidatus Zixiibacteriota bacterium]|nr:MAG: hypothetical protein JSV52_14400 [candidate division Zixibacteria bacterium]
MLFRKASRRRIDPAKSERILRQSFDTLRGSAPRAATPLSFIKTRLGAKAAQKTSRKESIMSRAMQILASRPKTGFTFAVFVAVLLFVTLVPFSYTKTVGYTVSFTGPDQEMAGDPNEIVAAIAALGYDNVTANFNSDGIETVWDIKGLPDYQAAVTAAAAFRTLTGADIEPTITPVLREVSGTLYAQVRDHLIEISVSVDEAASAEEIEAQIRAQLIAQGFEPANINVITNQVDSTVYIDLEIGE